MNMPSTVVSDFEKHESSADVWSATRPFYWSVVRELWQYRSIYVAPAGVAAVFLVGFIISLVHLPAKLQALDAAKQQAALQQPYNLAALLIMFAAFVVALFYCLEAFQSERRDRSILFWKSLPVSDLTTVLSKAMIPIVIIPLIAFAVTAVTHWIMFVVSSAVLISSGFSFAALWSTVGLAHLELELLLHLVVIHGLWYAPIYGWLLLVSAWARHAALLWAALPVLAVVFVERIAFNTRHFLGMLYTRFMGGPVGSNYPAQNMSDVLGVHHASEFLVGPRLWIGLALTALFLTLAVRLRRKRGPI